MKKTLSILVLGTLALGQLLLGATSYYGIISVPTAGTAVNVAQAVGSNETNCLQMVITADPSNTGTLYLGMSSAVSSTNYFAALAFNGSFNSGPSGAAPRFPCQSLWVNASVNGTKADVLIIPGN